MGRAAEGRSVASFVDPIDRVFTRAIDRSKRQGEFCSDVSASDEASWFTATLLGFLVLLRAQLDPSMLRKAGRAALRHVDGLRCRWRQFRDS